jgi:hypothetical protein
MGYRSDVAYKIQFESEDKWNVFLLEAKSKPETRLAFEDEELEVVHDKQEIRFVSCGTKWYSGYPDVDCHTHLLLLCDEYNDRFDEAGEHTCSYLFRRIGEEEDDIQCESGGDPDWDWIELHRSLQVNW